MIEEESADTFTSVGFMSVNEADALLNTAPLIKETYDFTGKNGTRITTYLVENTESAVVFVENSSHGNGIVVGDSVGLRKLREMFHNENTCDIAIVVGYFGTSDNINTNASAMVRMSQRQRYRGNGNGPLAVELASGTIEDKITNLLDGDSMTRMPGVETFVCALVTVMEA